MLIIQIKKVFCNSSKYPVTKHIFNELKVFFANSSHYFLTTVVIRENRKQDRNIHFLSEVKSSLISFRQCFIENFEITLTRWLFQMNSTLEPSTWGFNVFYGMSIVTLPLYFIILVCLVRLRQVSKSYRTTFYSLLLQHVS